MTLSESLLRLGPFPSVGLALVPEWVPTEDPVRYGKGATRKVIDGCNL